MLYKSNKNEYYHLRKTDKKVKSVHFCKKTLAKIIKRVYYLYHRARDGQNEKMNLKEKIKNLKKIQKKC